MHRRPSRPSLSILLCLLSMAFASVAPGQDPEPETPPKLLGQCTVAELGEEPYSKWFTSGAADYVPEPGVVEALAELDLDGVEIEVLFGTWCGDSRREVPRLVKLLETLDLDRDALHLVAVDNAEELHKRSPDGEEQGLGVYRVPTIRVKRGGQEVARIVEHPVLSLERDLLAILEGEAYHPSYASYPHIHRWFESGLLSDGNVSTDGLAHQLRPWIASESEIYSAARVLSLRGDHSEAIKLMAANCSLFNESARCYSRLAAMQIRAGELENGRRSVIRALERNEDRDEIPHLVELVDLSAVEDSGTDDGAAADG